ncbi:cytochrome P450 [Salinicoccus sp. CNSTN-B1]
MSTIKRDKGLDNTLKAMKEGYLYTTNQRKRLGAENIFETRGLGGKRILVLSGKKAAETFYDNDRIERSGTLPKRIVNTLFGKGAIHTTTGKKHIDRKALFMSLMTEGNLKYLRELTRNHWYMNTHRMEQMGRVNIYRESIVLLTKVGTKWAGVQAPESKIEEIATDMDIMIDSFKGLGSKFKGYRESVKARHRVEDWLEDQIIQTRKGKIHPPEGTALYEFAHWEDYKGNPMDSRLCAIDLMNTFRPLIAINRFVSFGLHAMNEYPISREKINNEEDYAYMFSQEVRRFYPFVPFLPGKAKTDFNFDGHDIDKDTFLLLDVYGTMHRDDVFENANEFRPERFIDWDGSPFDLIPQGGGDYYTNHRCAGEWMTVIIMEETMKYFAGKISYDVPEQDLTVDLNSIPGYVKSGFIIENVRENVDRK